MPKSPLSSNENRDFFDTLTMDGYENVSVHGFLPSRQEYRAGAAKALSPGSGSSLDTSGPVSAHELFDIGFADAIVVSRNAVLQAGGCDGKFQGLLSVRV